MHPIISVELLCAHQNIPLYLEPRLLACNAHFLSADGSLSSPQGSPQGVLPILRIIHCTDIIRKGPMQAKEVGSAADVDAHAISPGVAPTVQDETLVCCGLCIPS